MMDYRYTDKVIAYIDRQLIKRYSRLKSLVSFDELNVLQEVNDLHRDIGLLLRQALLKLAQTVYLENAGQAHLRDLDAIWLDEMLNAYDPVSKYVFTHEEDRKRARLIEALIASTTKTREVDAALRSMSYMCRIYAVRITDEAVLQAFRDDKVKWVMWVAEIDGKTCSVCLKLDGKVYPMDRLPPKPHPYCRCRYVRAP